MSQAKVWINGSEQNTLSIFDRGFAYGHGVFETLLLRNGQLVLLDLHLQRLERGLQCLGIDCSLELIQEDISAHILDHPSLLEGVVKIMITAGNSERGYGWPQPMQAKRILIYSSYDNKSVEQLKQQGANILLSQLRLAHQPALAGIKHLNRLEQVLIRREVEENACDEALVLDQVDCVIEGNSANVFMVHQGVISTPQLNLCGVSGVMRRYLLDTLLPSLGFNAVEKSISLDAFCQADEVFLSNSIGGVIPVISLNQVRQKALLNIQHWPIGSITQHIQQALDQFSH